MLSWITGARITNVAEDLQDPAYVEPPETPAPVFAARAFKHAIWGTPAPKDEPELQPQAQSLPEGLPISPIKPNGILMTPGTATIRRKTVSFGAHVVDNESKKPSRSGLPNNCPGKFPSPWTPRVDAAPETKSRTKLTAALYEAKTSSTNTASTNTTSTNTTASPATRDARTITDPLPAIPTLPALLPTPSPAKPRAKDDADITLDLSSPRSESGRYWKSQYVSYAARSEREVRRLIKKHQLAKSYAKKRDAEATELAAKLDAERRRHKSRERALESQVREYQERLRVCLADNAARGIEIGAMRRRVEDAEKGRVLQRREEEGKEETREATVGPVKADVADPALTPRSTGSRKSESSTRSEVSRISETSKGSGMSKRSEVSKTSETFVNSESSARPQLSKRTEASAAGKTYQAGKQEGQSPVVVEEPPSMEPQRAAQALQPRNDNAGKKPLQADRLAEAKARIAARRKEKENAPVAMGAS